MELNPEIEKKVRSWVASKRKEGVSDDEIRQHLKDKGYPAKLTNSLMRKRSPLWIIPLVIILAIGVYFLIPLISPAISGLFAKSCQDKDCFIASANSCDSVRLEQNEFGSLFAYYSKDCVFTKTAKSINQSETQEIKDLLEGKSMNCSYVAGDFNEDWINTISLGLEECSGGLKDSIEKLVASI